MKLGCPGGLQLAAIGSPAETPSKMSAETPKEDTRRPRGAFETPFETPTCSAGSDDPPADVPSAAGRPNSDLCTRSCSRYPRQ